MADYDQAMVTMLGDIAQNYVQIRTDQERIALLRDSVESSRAYSNYIAARFQAGFKVSKLDYDQALSNLRRPRPKSWPLEIDLRQDSNRLCTLLGIPAMDLQGLLGDGSHPHGAAGSGRGHPRRVGPPPAGRAAGRAAGGRPGRADRHRRGRSSIRSSPSTARWTGRLPTFKDLFIPAAFTGAVGPQFQWNILNYGRIRGNMIYQDALFKQLVVAYQAQVLQASQDAENGIVTFLKAQVEAKTLAGERGGGARGGEDRRHPVQGGRRRLQPLCDDRAGPDHAAGLDGAGPGPDRPGVDPDVSRVGRGVGDSLRRAERGGFAAAGRA